MCVFQKFRPLEVLEQQREVKPTEDFLWTRQGASQESTHRVLMTT